MRLQDKVAIVTGAGSGFGEGIARRFAAEGARVIVADINREGAERVAADIGEAAKVVIADVSKSNDVAAMVKAATEHFGGLDIVVNNAGYTHRNGPMLGVDEETFDRVFAVNVKSIYLAAQHAIPVFRRNKVVAACSSTSPRRPACARGRASPGTTAPRARRSR